MKKIRRMSLNISNDIGTTDVEFEYKNKGIRMFQLLREMNTASHALHMRGIGV